MNSPFGVVLSLMGGQKGFLHNIFHYLSVLELKDKIAVNGIPYLCST